MRSLGVLMVGNAIGDIDERGQLVSGDTLLILLNAHFESSAVRAAGRRRGPRVDACLRHDRSASARSAAPGGTSYALEGRTVVLFTLEKHRRHRRASDQEEVEAGERLKLQVIP